MGEGRAGDRFRVIRRPTGRCRRSGRFAIYVVPARIRAGRPDRSRLARPEIRIGFDSRVRVVPIDRSALDLVHRDTVEGDDESLVETDPALPRLVDGTGYVSDDMHLVLRRARPSGAAEWETSGHRRILRQADPVVGARPVGGHPRMRRVRQLTPRPDTFGRDLLPRSSVTAIEPVEIRLSPGGLGRECEKSVSAGIPPRRSAWEPCSGPTAVGDRSVARALPVHPAPDTERIRGADLRGQ